MRLRMLFVGLFLLSATSLTAQVSAPVVVKEVRPQYTPEAEAAKIEGEVRMSAVVLRDGTVGDVKITQSLDAELGLDNEAVKAVKQWQFEPGKKDGKPVPVSVTIQMAFTLKK